MLITLKIRMFRTIFLPDFFPTHAVSRVMSRKWRGRLTRSQNCRIPRFERRETWAPGKRCTSFFLQVIERLSVLDCHAFRSVHVLRTRIVIVRSGMYQEKRGLAHPDRRRKNLAILLLSCMLQSSYTCHGEGVLCDRLHR